MNDVVLMRNLFNASLKFSSEGHIDFSVFTARISTYVRDAVENGRAVYDARLAQELAAQQEAGY